MPPPFTQGRRFLGSPLIISDLIVIPILSPVGEGFPLPQNRRKSNNREAKRLPYGQGLFFDRRGGYHPPVFFVFIFIRARQVKHIRIKAL